MRAYLGLAWHSLLHRKETVLLTLSSLILSIFLLLSVDQLRRAAKEGFTQTISQTDLIVGARTGPTNLVLSTVFNQGTFTNNIKAKTYQKWKNHPQIEWTIPLVLGDGHKGFRVVGTTEDFYRHYRYQGQQSLQLQSGVWNQSPKDVVIGYEVAKKLHYTLGTSVIIEHGVTRDVGMLHHDDFPFHVVGVLQPTGTIMDQSLFVSLLSLEAIHHQSQKSPLNEQSSKAIHDHDEDEGADIEIHQHVGVDELTAFFMKLKNRIDILNIQREINNETSEPLSAVIPSVVVNDIWHMLSYVENTLRILGFCILLVSLFSMLSMLLATLNERRREMAILRSLGAGPSQLAGLLVLESSLLTVLAVTIGISLQNGILFYFQDWLKIHFGIFISPFEFRGEELFVMSLILVLGLVVGLIPALRVYRASLKEGLIVK